jgi:hypothetical protein
MKLPFTPRAARDLADIGDYIRERNPIAALRYTADEATEEIVIISIQHPAREREHADA